jgi:hypothetical protein
MLNGCFQRPRGSANGTLPLSKASQQKNETESDFGALLIPINGLAAEIRGYSFMA